ncbi:MAG: YfcC family protein [Clostridia bacterium]|nr:YfcC family protein [Clostridia bacterium]
MEKNKTSKVKTPISISAKSFILVMVVLLVIMIASGISTYFLPQGSYQFDTQGQLLPDTYTQADIKPYPVWKWFLAPILVFGSEDALNIIMVSLFLLTISGFFSVMENTHGIKLLVEKLVNHFSTKKTTVICLTTLIFMLFGSLFGMFEELVALLPIMVIISLSLGFDTMTGLGICLLASCFGFASAITNPFSVGVASEILEIDALSGVWLRLVFFALTYGLLCVFLIHHSRRIEKTPSLSPTYENDLLKRKELVFDSSNTKDSDRITKIYLIFFTLLIAALILIYVFAASYSVPLLILCFLLGSLVTGTLLTGKFSLAFKWFLSGVKAMLPAIVMIAFASSVKFIMTDGGVLYTVVHVAIDLLSGMSPFASILILYGLVLFVQLFIGSASAKAMLIMPIIAPICSVAGISKELALLAFVFGDGFTNVIFPTNAVLLIGLSMANVSYGKWFRHTILLQLLMLTITSLVLLFGVAIGY